MARESINLEIGNKKFKIMQPSCLEARRAFLLLQESENRVENREKVLKILLSNIEMDFGQGRTSFLDSDEVIKQNLTLPELLKLEDEACKLTFGFLTAGGI